MPIPTLSPAIVGCKVVPVLVHGEVGRVTEFPLEIESTLVFKDNV